MIENGQRYKFTDYLSKHYKIFGHLCQITHEFCDTDPYCKALDSKNYLKKGEQTRYNIYSMKKYWTLLSGQEVEEDEE